MGSRPCPLLDIMSVIIEVTNALVERQFLAVSGMGGCKCSNMPYGTR